MAPRNYIYNIHYRCIITSIMKEIKGLSINFDLVLSDVNILTAARLSSRPIVIGKVARPST